MTPKVSRRQLLQGGGAAAAAVLLWACGDASRASTTGSLQPPSRSPAPTPAPSGPPISAPSPSTTATLAPMPSLEARIARLLVVGFRGLSVDEAGPIASAIADDGLGGVILFDEDQLTGGRRNIESPDQLRALVEGLRALAPDRRLLVAIDQEGGRVARLSPATGFPSFAGEAEIAAQGDAAVRAWARSIAATLESVGIDVNLAPVVDLNVNPLNPAIGALGRSFSDDAATVARLASIEVLAHREAGVATVLKHFPGLGSASTNTDFGVADVTGTWTRRELEPYRTMLAAGDVDAIMVGHVVNGQLDPDAPASLSHATVSGLLRGELGWDGVVVTDDLQAAAITEAFGAYEAIELAINAGDDLLLLANQQSYDPDIAARVISLVAGKVRDGTIPEARIDESYARVLRFAAG